MKWVVNIRWPEGEEQLKQVETTGDLKTFLDMEVFCLQHDCPLPVQLTIERVEERTDGTPSGG